MSNPFTGILSEEFKQTYRYAMDELLRGLSRPCKLIYGNSVFTECPNCIIDVAGKKSANIYKAGGPIVFEEGLLCPYCNGEGMIPTQSTEILQLAIVWSYQGNMPWAANFPRGSTITICSSAYQPNIKRCNQVILDFTDGDDTGIELYKEHTFVRDGEPQPAGLGSHDYIMTAWKNK